jgi:hypothetical protein
MHESIDLVEEKNELLAGGMFGVLSIIALEL